METGIWPGQIKHKKGMKQTVAWADAKQKKLERREKRKKKKELRKQMELEGKSKAKRKREQAFSEEELNDLAKDISLMKKLKSKKVSYFILIFNKIIYYEKIITPVLFTFNLIFGFSENCYSIAMHFIMYLYLYG